MNIFAWWRLLVDQSVEGRSESTSPLLPGCYDLITRCVGHRLAKSRVVEEVIMRPVVERRSGKLNGFSIAFGRLLIIDQQLGKSFSYNETVIAYHAGQVDSEFLTRLGTL